MRLSSVLVLSMSVLALPVACSSGADDLFGEGTGTGQGTAGSSSSGAGQGGAGQGGSGQGASTSSSDGSGGTTDGGSGPGSSSSGETSSSSTSTGSSVSIPCGSETCTGDAICCVHRYESSLDKCGKPGQCGDASSWVEVACNGPMDCMPSEVCCGTFQQGAGYLEISCKPSCSNSSTTFGITMCGDDPNACDANQTCSQSNFLPQGHSFCQ